MMALGLIAGLHHTAADDESDPMLLNSPTLDLSEFTEQTAPDSNDVQQVSVEIDHVQKGLSYHRQGLFAQAVESYRKHLAYDDDNADAWHLMGLATQQKSDSEMDKVNAEIYIKKVKDCKHESTCHCTLCDDIICINRPLLFNQKFLFIIGMHLSMHQTCKQLFPRSVHQIVAPNKERILNLTPWQKRNTLAIWEFFCSQPDVSLRAWQGCIQPSVCTLLANYATKKAFRRM